MVILIKIFTRKIRFVLLVNSMLFYYSSYVYSLSVCNIVTDACITFHRIFYAISIITPHRILFFYDFAFDFYEVHLFFI